MYSVAQASGKTLNMVLLLRKEVVPQTFLNENLPSTQTAEETASHVFRI